MIIHDDNPNERVGEGAGGRAGVQGRGMGGEF